MKRNFDTVLLDLEGNNFQPPATLRDACFAALQSQLKGDSDMTTQTKIDLFSIASKIVRGGVVDLSPPELTALRDRVGRAMTPLAVGVIFGHLDADYVEPAAPAVAAA